MKIRDLSFRQIQVIIATIGWLVWIVIGFIYDRSNTRFGFSTLVGILFLWLICYGFVRGIVLLVESPSFVAEKLRKKKAAKAQRELLKMVLGHTSVSRSTPRCSLCAEPLKLEESHEVPSGLPRCYLGTVCKSCGRIECYSCRGGVGLPCSLCSGSVNPVYEHLIK